MRKKRKIKSIIQQQVIDMKFREMSWEELKSDFRKKLDKYTIKELVKSLEKYKKKQ